MVGQMESKNSKVTFVTKIIFENLGVKLQGSAKVVQAL